jgi:hypothetical protein
MIPLDDAAPPMELYLSSESEKTRFHLRMRIRASLVFQGEEPIHIKTPPKKS